MVTNSAQEWQLIEDAATANTLDRVLECAETPSGGLIELLRLQAEFGVDPSTGRVLGELLPYVWQITRAMLLQYVQDKTKALEAIRAKQ